jgi:hypothetical protein
LLPAVLEGQFRGPVAVAGRAILAAAAVAFLGASFTPSVVSSAPWALSGIVLTAVVWWWQRRAQLLTGAGVMA